MTETTEPAWFRKLVAVAVGGPLALVVVAALAYVAFSSGWAFIATAALMLLAMFVLAARGAE